MNKLKVGILGCANIAIRYLAPSFQSHESFELIAFAGRDINKTMATAKLFDCESLYSYQDMIERNDIDLIYIPLPNSFHYEWVIKSLQSGKHVLCEKSLGCSYEEVKTMVALARKNQRLLVENFQFRFHSQHQVVKKMIDDGEIGEVRCFRSSFGFPPFSNVENIRYNKELGGGSLLDAGSYTIKAVQFILGDNFDVTSAIMNFSKENDIDIYGGIFMQNKKGVFAELAFGFDNFYQCNYEIWGSKGKLIATRAFTAAPEFEPIIILEKQGFKEEIKLHSDNHFLNILTYIKNCIQSNSFEQENTQNLKQAFNINQVKKLALKNYY